MTQVNLHEFGGIGSPDGNLDQFLTQRRAHALGSPEGRPANAGQAMAVKLNVPAFEQAEKRIQALKLVLDERDAWNSARSHGLVRATVKNASHNASSS
ncbi:hypothetical protein [Phenylobacterium sp.]|jgi:hypothetical protein|uniref:hypothetical protein n=1 Tax=Phenylobacterium sp. TaxID=1871053 RepID=UPI002F421BCB